MKLIIILSALVFSLLGNAILYRQNRQMTGELASFREEESRPVETSIDDDPILGDPNAPITLIEFADFECPYCKKFFLDTLQRLKKDYIDPGLVRFVYRDFPLPIHEPNATTQAIAANCARAQGGNRTYFLFHDEIFKRTPSNAGLKDGELPQIAKDIGLSVTEFESCLQSRAYDDEVKNDGLEATRLKLTGTPVFVVGKTNPDKTVNGVKIIGLPPYGVFKTIIDQQLSRQ